MIKNILFLITLNIMCSTQVFSQIEKPFFLETNMARYTKSIGIFPPEYYCSKFSFLNGLKAGYQFSEQQNAFLGFRKVYKDLTPFEDYTYEIASLRGFEVNLGWEFTPNAHKRFHLSYQVEFFEEVVVLKGNNYDFPPSKEIHHRRIYLGLAPALNLNYKINPRLKILAGSRWRFGYYQMVGLGKIQRNNRELYRDTKGGRNIFEPLANVGVRWALYRLKIH